MIGVTIITFILLHMIGNPVNVILGTHHSLANVRALTIQLGLNKSLPQQYLIWLWNLLHFNLGWSYRQNSSVAGLLGQRLPNTLLLGRHLDSTCHSHRRASRDDAGGPAQQARRLCVHWVLLRLLRHAHLLAGNPADHRLQLPAQLAAPPRRRRARAISSPSSTAWFCRWRP